MLSYKTINIINNMNWFFVIKTQTEVLISIEQFGTPGQAAKAAEHCIQNPQSHQLCDENNRPGTFQKEQIEDYWIESQDGDMLDIEEILN